MPFYDSRTALLNDYLLRKAAYQTAEVVCSVYKRCQAWLELFEVIQTF